MTNQNETNEEKVLRLQSATEASYEKEILSELWEQNYSLVKIIIHKLTGLSDTDNDFEDLTQEAYFGFRAAAYAFDPERGIKFSSYAGKRIEWELCRYYENSGCTVHIPAYLKKRLREAAEKKNRLEAETGCAVSLETALKALGLSQSAILGTVSAFQKLQAISLDSYTTGDDDSITLLDTLTSNEDIEDYVISQDWNKSLRKLLFTALQDIPEDEREIIIRQYFHGIPIWKMAEESGQTRQTIWNKKNEAFRCIRAGRYGPELAEYMPTVSKYEKAQRLIMHDREAIKQLHLTDTERGLLIL